MPRLLIVRHGQASFGAADYDRLSELGVRQAQVTARALRDAGIEVDRVLAGSLRRQRDTAAPIAGAYGLATDADRRLDEYDADAVLAGHSAEAVRLERPATPAQAARDPRAFQAALEAALTAWIAATPAADAEDEAAAGTDPAAETFPAFAARVSGALAGALSSGARTTVICTSGGVIAAIAAALTGGGDRAFVALNRVCVNCAISRVVSGRGGTSLLSFNEQQHLTPELISYR